ncbi:MAG: hypothetical protein V4658_00155 [Bacteroidota bacterium]
MKTLYFLFAALIIAGCGNNDSKPSETVTDSIASHDTIIPEPVALSNKSITVAWRANVYYSQLQDSVSTILLDTSFCKQISEPERAAIGFVVTFIGNECYWDGDAKEDMSNLKCRVTDALHLGYQCSDTHLKFLREWFKNDQASLSRIKDCPLIPHTASSQTTFDEIRLTVKDSVIKVWYRANGMDMRTNDAWYWTQEDTFEVEADGLKLVKQQKLKERKEKFAA